MPSEHSWCDVGGELLPCGVTVLVPVREAGVEVDYVSATQAVHAPRVLLQAALQPPMGAVLLVPHRCIIQLLAKTAVRREHVHATPVPCEDGRERGIGIGAPGSRSSWADAVHGGARARDGPAAR